MSENCCIFATSKGEASPQRRARAKGHGARSEQTQSRMGIVAPARTNDRIRTCVRTHGTAWNSIEADMELQRSRDSTDERRRKPSDGFSRKSTKMGRKVVRLTPIDVSECAKNVRFQDKIEPEAINKMFAREKEITLQRKSITIYSSTIYSLIHQQTKKSQP